MTSGSQEPQSPGGGSRSFTSPACPLHKGALYDKRELRPGAVIRRHFGDGRHADFVVVAHPTPIRSGQGPFVGGHEVALRPITQRRLTRKRVVGGIVTLPLADMGIEPFCHPSGRKSWHSTTYTTVVSGG